MSNPFEHSALFLTELIEHYNSEIDKAESIQTVRKLFSMLKKRSFLDSDDQTTIPPVWLEQVMREKQIDPAILDEAGLKSSDAMRQEIQAESNGWYFARAQRNHLRLEGKLADSPLPPEGDIGQLCAAIHADLKESGCARRNLYPGQCLSEPEAEASLTHSAKELAFTHAKILFERFDKSQFSEDIHPRDEETIMWKKLNDSGKDATMFDPARFACAQEVQYTVDDRIEQHIFDIAREQYERLRSGSIPSNEHQRVEDGMKDYLEQIGKRLSDLNPSGSKPGIDVQDEINWGKKFSQLKEAYDRTPHGR
jgi:hypothetical protein